MPLSTYFDATGDATKTAARARGAKLCLIVVHNADAVESFIQLFDAAAADVTVGTTTPKLSLAIEAASVLSLYIAEGIVFDTAVVYACTTTATGNTGPTTDLKVNLGFK